MRTATEKDTLDIRKDVTRHVSAMYKSLDTSLKCLERIKLETAKGQNFMEVIDYYHKGSPNSNINITESIGLFLSMRQELHVIDVIFFTNEKIVKLKSKYK